MSLRIGIDVGGTNTDAVLMDGLTVISKIKTPTTPDVTTGIATALRHVLETSATPTSAISGVMIGTTHFTNAVVERKRLEPTAAVRLGLPATLALPPMVDWPDDLAQVLGRHTYLCHGGHEFDGREISPLDPDEIREVAKEISDKRITAPLYITQNDGTLMSADYAEQYPVLTFASGPTNSMRGAAFLSGLKDAMVVDVGGTTSDVGAPAHGFPREASVAVDIGGVRTNFRMPDVYSFGLGGGSLVREDPLRVGPQSVGYRITEEALVFGGDTLTTPDIAVAAGAADIGGG